jgi:hypothetical protein
MATRLIPQKLLAVMLLTGAMILLAAPAGSIQAGQSDANVDPGYADGTLKLSLSQGAGAATDTEWKYISIRRY